MPDCYLLVVSQNSSLDKYTNTWSIFLLVESFQLEGDISQNIVAPLEIHTHWLLDPEDLGIEFEIRIVHDTHGNEIFDDKIYPLLSDKRRHRIRITGFPIKAEGAISLRVEWREKGSTSWNRCAVSWPFNVTILPAKS